MKYRITFLETELEPPLYIEENNIPDQLEVLKTGFSTLISNSKTLKLLGIDLTDG